MEKQVKKIADELRLIRKELQKSNANKNIVENTTVMYEAEPIFSKEKYVEQITDRLAERMKRI